MSKNITYEEVLKLALANIDAIDKMREENRERAKEADEKRKKESDDWKKRYKEADEREEIRFKKRDKELNRLEKMFD
ncbi:MAG TPA: hypothetical protein EYG72_02345 [Candidatus Pacebacteria bacterium]|nr:hypothetical protein [Candidatus Paceibacterota bacterium]